MKTDSRTVHGRTRGISIMQGALACGVMLVAGTAGCGTEDTDPEGEQTGVADSTSEITGFELGVNTHQGGTAAYNDQIATLMKQRNLTTARMDLMPGDQTALRDQVQKIRANGGSVQVALQISYQWDHSCDQNLAYVEQDAYNQTATAVHQVKDIVHDFELLNETQLRPEILAEVPWNTAGTSTAPYEGKPCVATLTATLRGMSRAIHDIRASSGLYLRVILGEVGRDFGFLTFMRQQGVVWDVTGFHIYPHANHASLLNDPWFGPGGPLAQLASFGKPLHINEFNCGEIYNSGYENQAGAAVTETCLQSLDKHLTDLKSQAIADIESVHMYELFDEPQKAAPENRFGLMYDLARPKPHLYLVTAFAGGTLSAQDRDEITGRGLLTEAEIDAMQGAPAPAPAPTDDTQVPVVGITSPVNGSVFGRHATISATATASDNVAVEEVRFYLDGVLRCADTSAPYQCQITLPSKKRWTGTLEAHAIDAAGNLGRSSIGISAR